MAKIKIGDRIVFGRCKRNKDLRDATVGKIYTVVANRAGGAYCPLVFIDDVGDQNGNGLNADAQHGNKATKIVD